MTRGLSAILLVIATLGIVALTTTTASAGCDKEQVTLHSASQGCIKTAEDIRGAQGSGDGHVYTVEINCAHITGSTCGSPATCGTGTDAGHWYTVLRDGENHGRVCLSPDDAISLGAFDPTVVLREFRRIDWATPELTIQPPNGKTLVNLETIFSTTTATPQTRTLTLLGQRVTITATPAEYIWHPGTGLPTWRTTTPGQPWTTGADETQLNHYVYRDAGTTVTPWLEIVYTGTYTVNGGPEQTITETRTITGPTQTLQIVEARPVLTGS